MDSTPWVYVRNGQLSGVILVIHSTGLKMRKTCGQKAIKTQHSFLGQQNMKKNAGTTQYGADFHVVFCSLWLRLRKNMDKRQNIAGG